ncbi:MAG: DNA recombination/repair protein RecA [Acidobacteriia bacterium]|nr:DNA recombination/repair protein RecA [Terriglobia bacterium]
MSSAVVSTSAALGRPFLFDAEPDVDGYCHPERSVKCAKRISRGVEGSLPYSKLSPDPRLASITSASRLEIRPAPEMVTSGIPALDALTGGLPRGCLTEICGPASSGRTTVLLAALAAATRRGEYCAVIDASDALDPHSLAAVGIDLDRMLWVRCGDDIQQKPPKSATESAGAPPLSRTLRQGGVFDFLSQSPLDCWQNEVERSSPCSAGNSPPQKSERNTCPPEHRLEQVLRATDLLLESGGFGLIILDLADLPPQAARRIPLTTWFRFRRAIEHKPTILLAIEQQPIAGSCSSLLLQLGTADSPAAKRRKNAAHGASRGLGPQECEALEGRKKVGTTAEKPTEFSYPPHTNLLTELEIHAELIRSRLDRKPAHSITFETKTAWAG